MCDALTFTSPGSDAGCSTENCISSAIKNQKKREVDGNWAILLL